MLTYLFPPKVRVESLERTSELLGESEASVWSALSPAEVQENLSKLSCSISVGEAWSRLDLAVEFAVTSTVQEIAIWNDWHDEYVLLAAVVDQYTGR